MIYLAKSESGVIKVGRSNDPRKRMSSLQAEFGFSFELLLVAHGDATEENHAHSLLKDYAVKVAKVNGTHSRECYNISEDLASVLFIDEFNGQTLDEFLNDTHYIELDRESYNLLSKLMQERNMTGKSMLRDMAELYQYKEFYTSLRQGYRAMQSIING